MASINGLVSHQQIITYALEVIRERRAAAEATAAKAREGRHDPIAASGLIAEHRDQGCSTADTLVTMLISMGADDAALRPLATERYALHRDLSALVHGVRSGGLEVRELTL